MDRDATPKWLEDEWEKIAERRRHAFGDDREPTQAGSKPSPETKEPSNLLGLSLSGGGIRSALFNDGFLQGLSHRGLLRYVDYLCSVSGGGYIAGHLISQAKTGDSENQPTSESKEEAEQTKLRLAFHDDPKRFTLGRDPATGLVDAARLAGIGGYLSRTLDFLPAYLWSFFFSFAFYIGMAGVCATLAAMFWRSFDDPVFRELYFSTLGLRAGSELLVAFIPVILLVSGYTFVEATLSLYRLRTGLERPGARQVHGLVRRVSLILVILALLTSIAIFLGNGKTNVQSNASGFVYLNHYFQYFIAAAVVIQVLVFLTRDLLFRSERGDSKKWQKYLQYAVTTLLLLLLVFSMVHWMGREDVSGYTRARDLHLARGDVVDWFVMNQIMVAYSKSPYNDGTSAASPLQLDPADVNPGDALPRHVKPSGRWMESVAVGRLGLFGFDSVREEELSSPPSPRENEDLATSKLSWSLPKRIYGAFIAYCLAMSTVPAAGEPSAQIQDTSPSWHDANTSVPVFVAAAIGQVHKVNRDRDRYLSVWNRDLEKLSFTSFLLDEVFDEAAWSKLKAPAGGDVSEKLAAAAWVEDARPGYGVIAEKLSKLLNSTNAELSGSHRTALLNAIRHMRLSEKAEHPRDLASERQRTATANRLLLETFYPNVVQQHDIPSTLVVPPHDQRARRRWLGFWMLVALVGTIGGLGPYRVATVFQFYRRQLGNSFLVSSPLRLKKSTNSQDSRKETTDSPVLPKKSADSPVSPKESERENFADKELRTLCPTADGLPYPLILAATLEPTTLNGSYRVEARPFVFSPLYSGRFDRGAQPLDSHQLSFSLNPKRPRVTLGDAVTLSGAAVTPLMTSNIGLSVILDFFNTGIGQRLRRPDLDQRNANSQTSLSGFAWALPGIGVLFLAPSIVGLSWPMSVLATVLAWLLAFCVSRKIGSPGLICSLLMPRKQRSDEMMPSIQGSDESSAGDDAKKEDERSFYIADGGFFDYLGVSELLRRRCELIIVSDAGANVGDDALGTLARMCEGASNEMGIRFLDLDHEAPIDFGRLQITDKRLVHQPYICMRIRYPEQNKREGMLFYCQMSITESDPIEIQQIRNLFPSFPDEPTVNQCYSERQVTAYRTLGYHIASRLCSELERWPAAACERQNCGPANLRDGEVCGAAANKDVTRASSAKLAADRQSKAERFRSALENEYGPALSSRRFEVGSDQGQPLFRVLKERLLTSYRLMCYEELSYRKDDIYTEAIWPSATFAFPTFRESLEREIGKSSSRGGSGAPNYNDLAERWLRTYETSADVRSAYRTAVIHDINALDIGSDCLCAVLWRTMWNSSGGRGDLNQESMAQLLTSHLTNMGAACQEIHRGRPHSAFQVGGREKLIQLCRSVARAVCYSLNELAQSHSQENLLAALDGVMSELIELERSVFQGCEHVTTISFAQCMSCLWGRLARYESAREDASDDVRSGLIQAFLGVGTGTLENGHEGQSAEADNVVELRVAELRSQLDVGLSKMRLRLVRQSLAKSWYLGYFQGAEIQQTLDIKQVREEGPRKAARARLDA